MLAQGKDAVYYFLSAVAMLTVAGALTSEITFGASKSEVKTHYEAMSQPINLAVDIEPEVSNSSKPKACRIVHKAVPNKPLRFIAKKLSKVRLFKRRNR